MGANRYRNLNPLDQGWSNVEYLSCPAARGGSAWSTGHDHKIAAAVEQTS
jgi:hypothetical protein